jgi:hypothetical protein
MSCVQAYMKMNWHVILNGDRPILDGLSIEKDSCIIKSGEDYILKLEGFADHTSVSDIKTLVSEYLDILNGVLFLQDSIPTAIRIQSIYNLNEDGSRNIFLSPEPAVLTFRGFAPTITVTHNSGETTTITPYQDIFSTLLKAKSKQQLKDIFKEVKNGDFDFPTLHKIIEIIRSTKGSKVYDWVSKRKIDLLMHTSQTYRHGVVKFKSPPKPMSLLEAQQITRNLIEKYVSELGD